MNVYVTDHEYSRIVCHAFAEGQKAKIVPASGGLLDGPAVVYGILRGCGDIIKKCQWLGRDFYYIDHGYFKRGFPDGYFRICKNGLQSQGGFSDDGQRWRELNLVRKLWNKNGQNIVVCPISQYLGNFLGIDPEAWTKTVIQEIKRHTDKPIVIKHKNEGTIGETLKDAHCLITFNSNTAVDALVSGVPVVVLGPSVCKPLSGTWEDLDSPCCPSRQKWCFHLANQQFTLDEMRRGIDLSRLS